MSCAIEFLPPVFFVRWKVPELADIRRIVTQLTTAHQSLGRPVFFISIIPGDSNPPDDRMRQTFIENKEGVLAHCRTMHFAMEGEGFKHSILRNALATVLLFRGQRNRLFVHRSLSEALISANQQAAPKEKFDVAAISRKAEAANLVTAPRTKAAGR